MKLEETVLKKEERIAFSLRQLYRQYGYLQYKMSKFEEYDLYARNRDYLVSDNVITFTDTNGKLMALKPDVTLSIVRSIKDIPGYVNKYFYNENVYRVSRGSHMYKEIMQAGLECIGDIDDYNIFETVLLAVKSLEVISAESILNVSHLGIIISLLDEINMSDEDKKKAIKLIGDKNMHEFEALCKSCGSVPEKANAGTKEAGAGEEKSTRSIDSIMKILMLNGTPEEVIPVLEAEGCDKGAVEELKTLSSMLNAAGEGSRVVIDFSVVSNMSYYNGIVFKGYINGVPESVLSGGQYDRLLRKMGKRSRAVGFAVYMDFLERYFENDTAYDVDAVIKYDDNTDRRSLFNAVQVVMNKGLKVMVQKEIPEKLRFKALYTIDKYGALKEMPKEAPEASEEENKNRKEAL